MEHATLYQTLVNRLLFWPLANKPPQLACMTCPAVTDAEPASSSSLFVITSTFCLIMPHAPNAQTPFPCITQCRLLLLTVASRHSLAHAYPGSLPIEAAIGLVNGRAHVVRQVKSPLGDQL